MSSDVDAIVRVIIMLVNSEGIAEDKTLVDLAYLLGVKAANQKEGSDE